jgi:hypothetical protein
MQVQCSKCGVIATLGTTKWFFDGGECRELKGTGASDAKAYEQCGALSESISKAQKNVATNSSVPSG